MSLLSNTRAIFNHLRQKYFTHSSDVRPAYRNQTHEQKEAALAKAQAKRDRKASKRKTDSFCSYFYNPCNSY